MNIAVAMLLSIAGLTIGFFTWGKYVARRSGVNPNLPTPAVRINDGVDYVPAKPIVLLGHHYASIAAAGPIIGPTLALIYGFIPAWLWLLFGVIFIGAVHDFSALFVSVRENGRSIAHIAKKTLGNTGFALFLSFAILLIMLVNAAFLQLTAIALTSTYPISKLGLPPDQTLLKTTIVKGEIYGKIGGIASTSVIIITIFAPLVGYLLYKKHIKTYIASLIALSIVLISVIIGLKFPVSLNPQIWMVIILIYSFIASWIPVWVILQPRDFTNVHFLYIGLATMVLGIIGSGLAGIKIQAPTFNIDSLSMEALGPIWPFLFVTIACGAVSGAHSLIATGTTSKQISNEKYTHLIGYGAMLLESLLGMSVLLVILSAVDFEHYKELVWPIENGHLKQGNAPLAFAVSVGKTLNNGLGIPIFFGTIFGILMLEGFLITTIDTLFRLMRYFFEELWNVLFVKKPAILESRMFNALLAIILTAILSFTNGYQKIWPIFGSANQLLAALTLVAVTAWFAQKSIKAYFAAIPAGFMIITTMASLSILLKKYIESKNLTLTITDILLLSLASGVIVLTFKYFFKLRAELSKQKFVEQMK
ncbi:carbon starvation protein [Candidatus Thermokryptus mobilis]|uniref:Carbon starvation protein n=1 Tax=Candidatus Thermokryptus mobilis TaxID=1643428 RepID=A0A0S4NGE0_9BACT|nr:carbon starvation CstA family protein [Candidatus Thermokryptus mobilis]CUU09073.1 carbon starvation protein [Candidatus Thermokryptus mobilis]